MQEPGGRVTWFSFQDERTAAHSSLAQQLHVLLHRRITDAALHTDP